MILNLVHSSTGVPSLGALTYLGFQLSVRPCLMRLFTWKVFTLGDLV